MTPVTAAELSAIPLFSSLTRKDLQQAAKLFVARAYPKDAIVATEGDYLEFFNVVVAGRVQFFWQDAEGRQLRLGIDGPGGHFADVTLSGQPILMSVIALDELRIASIPMADLRQLLLDHPQVGNALLMAVVERLRRLVQRTKTFTMEDVYGRVVRLLLETPVDAGDRPATVRFTHAEIGQRVGATREMVGKVLRDLARGGYVEVARGQIRILRKLPARW